MRHKYMYTKYGVNVVDARGVTVDSWTVLLGLTKCTSYGISDREEYAKALALIWSGVESGEIEVDGH